ncbi:MAG: hypothetical protein Q9221_008641, partial [Calogaya cf. arnoldii]
MPGSSPTTEDAAATATGSSAVTEPIDRRRGGKAAERIARFAAIEAAKPAEEPKFKQRTDWDDRAVKTYAPTTEVAWRDSQQWFIEFLTHPDILIAGSEEEALKYFTPHGPPPLTNRVLRMYLEYTARTRPGRTSNLLSYRSLLTYLTRLAGALNYYSGHGIEPTVMTNAHTYIVSPMIRRKLLSTELADKPLFIPQDITRVLRGLCTPRYMASFQDTRVPMLIALYLTLAIDCSGRVGEMLNNTTEKKCNLNRVLCWKDITVYAFPPADPSSPSSPAIFKADVRFHGLKGSIADPTKQKTIPLRLLPLDLAAEDSLRWLLNLALID